MKKILSPLLLFLLSACAMAATVVPPHNSLEWTNPTLNADGSPLTDLVSVTFTCGGVPFTVPTTTPGASLSEPLPAGVLALSGAVTCTGIATSTSGGDSVIPSNNSDRWCDGVSCYDAQPAYCDAGVCYDAVPPDPPVLGSSGGSAQVPAWLSALAVNEAVEFGGTAINTALPDADPAANPNYPLASPWRGTTGPAAITSAWNGMAIDQAGNRAWITGGGHGDHGSQAFQVLDYGADPPAIALWDYPTPDVSATNGNADFGDGTPRPSHNWGWLEFHPPTQTIIRPMSSTSFPNFEVCGGCVWEFDTTVTMADKYQQHVAAWSLIGPINNLVGGTRGFQVYNPRDGWMYIGRSSGPPVGFGRYNPATNTFEQLLSTFQTGIGMGGAPTAAIASTYGDNGLLIIWRSDLGGFYVVDLATLQRGLASFTDLNPAVMITNGPVTFDPVNNCIWSWNGGNRLGKLPIPASPFTDPWVMQEVVVTGATLPLTPEPAGTFTRLRYDDDGALILVNKYDQNAFGIRVN